MTQGRTLRSVRLPGFVLTETSHAPDTSFEPHTHRFQAVTAPLAGTFAERVEGDSFHCVPGMVLWKKAGATHRNRYGSRGSRALIIEILQPTSLERSWEPTPRPARASEGLPWAMALGLYRMIDASPTALDVEELLAEILLPPPTDEGKRVPGVPRWLSRARDHVDQEWIDPPSLSDLAEEASVHPVYLARAFRRYYGRSVGELVRRKRVDRAVGALLDEEMSLSSLALRLGFYDQSHFTKCFRKATGMTPGEVRACRRT